MVDEIRLEHSGDLQELTCEIVAGCDGYCGPARRAIPAERRREFERRYPFAWFGVLVEGPPYSEELIYTLGGTPAPDGPYSIDELATDVVAVLDRLEIPRASYCGLSLGGMVGMWVAANAPDRIDRLVLMCTAANLQGQGYAERAAAVRASGTVEVVADAVLARRFTGGFVERRPELAARYRAILVTTSAEGYAGCYEAIEGLDLRSALSRITAPSLVIAGARLATPPECAWLIARRIRDARLEVLDGAAHLANVERPAAIGELIRQHLEL